MARAEDGLSEKDEGLAEAWAWSMLCTGGCTLMARDGTKTSSLPCVYEILTVSEGPYIFSI